GGSISENDEYVLFPGQISYLRTRNTGLTVNPADSEIWHLAVGKLFYKQFAIGLSVYHFNQRVVDEPLTEQWNGAIGGVYLISSVIGVAYVFENPAHASSNVPAGLRLQQQQSAGVYYSSPYNARLRLDLVQQLENNPNRRINIHGSIESNFSEF